MSSSAADRAAAASVFLVAAILALPFLAGIVMLDEGALVHTADRIVSGQVLYRDVATGIGPGAYYLQALLFRLFGASLLVGRIFMILLFASAAVGVYLLSRTVAERSVSLGASLAFAALTVSSWRYPNYSPEAIAWILLALGAAAAYLRGGSRRWLVAAGLALGTAILFKQNYGAFASLGIAAGLLAAPGKLRARVADVARTAAAAVAPIAAAVLAFAAVGAADDLWHDTVMLPLQLPSTLFARPFPPLTGSPGDTLRRQLLEYLPFQDLAMKMMPWPYEHLRTTMGIMRALFFLPPLVLLAAALLWALRLRASARAAAVPPANGADPGGRAAARVAVGGMLIATSAFLFLGVFPRVDAHHLVLVLAPSFTVVAWVLGRHPCWATRRLVGLATTALLLLATVSQGAGITGWTLDLSDQVFLELPRGHVWVSKGLSEQIDDLVGEVQRRVPPGEPIFVAPALPMYYFLADRPNPTRFPLILPGALDEEEAVRELEASGVRHALIADFAFEKFTFEYVAPKVWDYVRRSFGPAEGAGLDRYPFPPYLLRRGAREAPPEAELIGAAPSPSKPGWEVVEDLMQPSLAPPPPYRVASRGAFEEQLIDRVGWESMYLRPALVMRAPWGHRKAVVAWDLPAAPGYAFEFWAAIGPNGSPPISELGQGATVEVWVAGEGETPRRVWARWIDPHRDRQERRWFRRVVDLGSFVGAPRARVLLVAGPAPTLDAFDAEVAWTGLRVVRSVSAAGTGGAATPDARGPGAPPLAAPVEVEDASLGRLLEFDPSDLPLYREAARVYRGLGAAHAALAEAAALAGRDDLVLPARERATRLEPENPVHHVRLAEALERAGWKGRALGELRAATVIAPIEPNYRVALAGLLLRLGRLDDARAVVAGALELDGGHSWALTVLSAIERREGNFDAAEDAARRAIGRDPGSLRARLDLAEALRAAGRPDEAAAALEEASALPLAPRERAALAGAYARMARFDAAAAEWRLVLAAEPPEALREEARRSLDALARAGAAPPG